jgi:hypothetical protein
MDFNINNYTKQDLQEMFELSCDYGLTLVDIQENKLRENILNDKLITQDIKNKTVIFLNEAKDLLSKDLTKINNNNSHDVQERNPINKKFKYRHAI